MNMNKEVNEVTETTANLYGFCPVCYAPGFMRERRLNGDDKCKNGHWYPSKDALLSQPEK